MLDTVHPPEVTCDYFRSRFSYHLRRHLTQNEVGTDLVAMNYSIEVVVKYWRSRSCLALEAIRNHLGSHVMTPFAMKQRPKVAPR